MPLAFVCNGCARPTNRQGYCARCRPTHARARNRQPARVAHNSAHHERIRRYVLERDRQVCQIAGPGCTRIATTCDYIVALSRGGELSVRNAQAACLHCNSSKGAR